MSTRFLAGLVVLALAAGACSGSDTTESSLAQPSSTLAEGEATSTSTTTTTAAPTTTTTTTTEPPGFVPTLSNWAGYFALLTVPLDHDDPTGPTVEVPVSRIPATDPDNRIGVLLLNPGGPGYPATPLALYADQVLTPELRSRFDIVAFDPRGTFSDTSVNCFTGLTDLWSSVDYSPDAPGEIEALDAAMQAWVDDCEAEYGEMLDHVSTMDTVHDMAMLAEALGEDQVSYLGWSYGTTLGSAFVTEYPDMVRVAVFDGAYLAYGEPLESLIDSYSAMDDLLVRVFDDCDADPECPITGGAQEAFTQLARQFDEEPAVGNRYLPTINEQGFAAVIRFSDVAYGGSADTLLKAVADALDGDYFEMQSQLAGIADFLEAGGSAMAISCMDYPYREMVPMPDDALEQILAVAPTFSAVFPIPEGYDPFSLPDDCMRWPYGPDLLPDPLDGEGAGPILVVTATEDPVTPMASAEKLAGQLVNATLLVVESPVHGSYQIDIPIRTEARACATAYIDAFLIDLEIPSEGTFCGEE